MTWTRYRVFLLVLFVTTGSINTLSTKWADVIEAVGSDGVEKSFNHPFFQSLTMFLGEAMCLVLFKIMFRLYESRADGTVDSNELTKGNRKFNAFILCVPTACDMAATSLQNVGLNLTYASSFQMLRGSIIVFVGLLSVAFLRRRLAKREWGGIVLVMAGLSVVGVADFLYKSDDDSLDSDDVIIGDVLIVVGQVIQAIQVVVEEKFVAGMDIPPLEAVGFEGLFGLASMSLLMVPFYYIRADRPFTEHPGDRLDDIVDAFSQMGHSWQLDVAVLGSVLSIAFYNFAGISVTKEMSATTRMVLDSIRTLVVWVFSLTVFGQQFHWLQVLGFLLLVAGMCLYNGITFGSLISRFKRDKVDGQV